jgi:hypothetical protein
LDASSRAAETTIEALKHHVLSITVKRSCLATGALAAVRITIVPLLVVKVSGNPLLLGVVVVKVSPFEGQQIAAMNQVVDTDSVAVETPLSVTTVG